MSAAEALRDWLAPLLPGWKIQFGRWVDSGPAYRYAVVRPVGGPPSSIVRDPKFTLLLVAAKGDTETRAYTEALAVIEAARTHRDDILVSVQAADPVCSATSDGRPMAEVAITTATD